MRGRRVFLLIMGLAVRLKNTIRVEDTKDQKKKSTTFLLINYGKTNIAFIWKSLNIKLYRVCFKVQSSAKRSKARLEGEIIRNDVDILYLWYRPRYVRISNSMLNVAAREYSSTVHSQHSTIYHNDFESNFIDGRNGDTVDTGVTHQGIIDFPEDLQNNKQWARVPCPWWVRIESSEILNCYVTWLPSKAMSGSGIIL
ncbi:hypothetical protein BDC45DRAFT_531422 [Circinella umbellata]|nr:hypothetical protein BDC45DRAFT_531422 [Circinella umbellata]